MHLSDCKRGGKNCCCFRWPQTFLFFVSAHPRTLITQIGFTCPFLCNMIFKPRSKVKGVIEMKKVFTPTNENQGGTTVCWKQKKIKSKESFSTFLGQVYLSILLRNSPFYLMNPNIMHVRDFLRNANLGRMPGR